MTRTDPPRSVLSFEIWANDGIRCQVTNSLRSQVPPTRTRRQALLSVVLCTGSVFRFPPHQYMLKPQHFRVGA